MQSIVDLKSEIKWINKEGVKYKEIDNFLLLEWNLPLKHRNNWYNQRNWNHGWNLNDSLIWYVGETKRNIWIKNEKLKKWKAHC